MTMTQSIAKEFDVGFHLVQLRRSSRCFPSPFLSFPASSSGRNEQMHDTHTGTGRPPSKTKKRERPTETNHHLQSAVYRHQPPDILTKDSLQGYPQNSFLPRSQQHRVNNNQTSLLVQLSSIMDSVAENVVPVIQAMRRQEQSVYSCIDSLHQQQPSSLPNGPLSSYTASPECREKMVNWSYKVCSVKRYKWLSRAKDS